MPAPLPAHSRVCCGPSLQQRAGVGCSCMQAGAWGAAGAGGMEGGAACGRCMAPGINIQTATCRLCPTVPGCKSQRAHRRQTVGLHLVCECAAAQRSDHSAQHRTWGRLGVACQQQPAQPASSGPGVGSTRATARTCRAPPCKTGGSSAAALARPKHLRATSPCAASQTRRVGCGMPPGPPALAAQVESSICIGLGCLTEPRQPASRLPASCGGPGGGMPRLRAWAAQQPGTTGWPAAGGGGVSGEARPVSSCGPAVSRQRATHPDARLPGMPQLGCDSSCIL